MNQSGKYLQQPGVLHVKRSTWYDTSEVLFHQNDGTEMKTNTRFFTNVQANFASFLLNVSIFRVKHKKLKDGAYVINSFLKMYNNRV